MQKISAPPILIVLGLVAVTALSFGQTAGRDSRREILAAGEAWNEAMAKHDAEAAASLVAPNFHSVNAAFQRNGMTAVRDGLASLFKMRPDVVLARKTNRVEVNDAWGVASEEGTWTERWAEKDGSIELRGTYFVLWRRINGKWKQQADVFVPESCTGGDYCRPNAPRVIATSDEDALSKYAGWYEMSDGSILEIRREGSYLVAQGPLFRLQDQQVLTQKSQNDFSTPTVRPGWEVTSIHFSLTAPDQRGVAVEVRQGKKQVSTGRKLAPDPR